MVHREGAIDTIQIYIHSRFFRKRTSRFPRCITTKK